MLIVRLSDNCVAIACTCIQFPNQLNNYCTYQSCSCMYNVQCTRSYIVTELQSYLCINIKGVVVINVCEIMSVKRNFWRSEGRGKIAST